MKTTLAIAAEAVLPAVSMMVWLAPGGSVSELGLLATPAGRALSITVVVPVKPLSAVTVTFIVCPLPGDTVSDCGVSVSVKSAGGT